MQGSISPWLGALLVAVTTGALLLVTSFGLPMVWDEGDAIGRSDGIARWVGRWWHPAFSQQAIAEDWSFTTQREGHPAFYGIVIAAGRAISAGWLPPLEQARLGPIVLFAAAAGAMFYRLAREYSTVAAAGAVAALVLLPRMFAHAHFASFDGPLVSCWILTWATFAPTVRRVPLASRQCRVPLASRQCRVPLASRQCLLSDSSLPPPASHSGRLATLGFCKPRAEEHWRDASGTQRDASGTQRDASGTQRDVSGTQRDVSGTRRDASGTWPWAILWGVALGLTLSTKATGWLAPLPFLLWAAVYRDRGAFRAMLIGLPTALLVFLLLNPPLWHQPIQGGLEFFTLNTHRAELGLNIATQFLGHRYNLDYPLPWYNTLFWTAITVPVGILVLAGLGLWHVVRHPSDRPGMLLVAHWLVLLVVRAIPGTPPHDGVRLFLPSFAFLAALAGVGAGRVVHWMWQKKNAQATGAAWSVVSGWGFLVLVYLGSAASLVWYAPQWLSYYNLLIGGLPGAAALGMEPTYYWDGLDRSVLDWLAEHSGPDEKVQFAAAPEANLTLMRQWGLWRGEHRREAAGQFRWYVLQHRPGVWQPADRWLVEHQQPAFRKQLRQTGWGPWRLTVPLVDVYSYQQFRWACQAAPPR